MNEIERNLLTKSLTKYRSGEYDEKAFHDNLETVIPLLTESHLKTFRARLEDIEAELQKIDFLSNNKRIEYLKQLNLIEKVIAEYAAERRKE